MSTPSYQEQYEFLFARAMNALMAEAPFYYAVFQRIDRFHSEYLDCAACVSLRKTKRPFPDSSLAARARRALLNEGFPGKPYVA